MRRYAPLLLLSALVLAAIMVLAWRELAFNPQEHVALAPGGLPGSGVDRSDPDAIEAYRKALETLERERLAETEAERRQAEPPPPAPTVIPDMPAPQPEPVFSPDGFGGGGGSPLAGIGEETPEPGAEARLDEVIGRPLTRGLAGVDPEPAEPVVRHPYLDAPNAVAPGQDIVVTAALTLDKETPDLAVRAGPGATKTEDGALDLALPQDRDSWTVNVDLVAAGFDFADGGPASRPMTLYRDDDSDFVRFAIRARPDIKPGRGKITARFYHEGTFLGSAARPIALLSGDASARRTTGFAAQPQAADQPAGEVFTDGPVTVGARQASPDIDMLVAFDDPARPSTARVYIHSGQFSGSFSEEFVLPEGAEAWVDAMIGQIVSEGRSMRGARALGQDAAPAEDAEARRRRLIAFAEGFGDELYRRYTPEVFRSVLETLQTFGSVESILVSTNSPVIPWELVLPPAREGEDRRFLGIGYRLARWTPRDSGALSDRPGDHLVFDGIAAIAPAYNGAQRLPFQAREIAMLKGIDGFVPVEGRFSALEALVRDPVRAFIHFSGHGMDGSGGDGKAPFSILLEDLAMDPVTWKRLAAGGNGSQRPFYFFNACDSGSARVTGGFVRGWGTTVLEAGAAGFIGGLWPLSDEAAADFAGDYYARLAAALAGDEVYLADVLREVRLGFYRTGDPNYLAYSFYGDPNLTVSAAPGSP